MGERALLFEGTQKQESEGLNPEKSVTNNS
jgi:hypothetical protein